MKYRGKQQNPMDPHEHARGWVFFALFVLVFPLMMGWVQTAIGGDIPVAEANVVYYLLSVTLVMLVLWNYLRSSFDQFLDHLPDGLFAIATGLVGTVVLLMAVNLLPLPVDDPNFYDYREEYLLAPAATVAIVVVLMPIVEEVLFRGLLFGSLRGYSRVLAWVVSVLAYALYCVWRFVFAFDGVDLRYLLLALRYLPIGLGAAWCCDRSGSVWPAVLLHMAVNGLRLFYIVGA